MVVGEEAVQSGLSSTSEPGLRQLWIDHHPRRNITIDTDNGKGVRLLVRADRVIDVTRRGADRQRLEGLVALASDDESKRLPRAVADDRRRTDDRQPRDLRLRKWQMPEVAPEPGDIRLQ